MSKSRKPAALRLPLSDRPVCSCAETRRLEGYGALPVTHERDGILLCATCAKDYDRWRAEEDSFYRAMGAAEAYGTVDVVDTMSGGSYVRG